MFVYIYIESDKILKTIAPHGGLIYNNEVKRKQYVVLMGIENKPYFSSDENIFHAAMFD